MMATNTDGRTGVNLGVEVQEFLDVVFCIQGTRWIVPVERKGTALIRTRLDHRSIDSADVLGWQNVLSSDAIERVSQEAFRDGIVVLLDEGVHRGRKMDETIHRLMKRGVPRARIRTAAFSVHEHSQFTDVDVHWYGKAEDRRYRLLRDDIVAYLQAKGSLLLDTEHIELIVNLRCGQLEFFDALCQAGIGVEHRSAAGQLNLTVCEPYIIDEPGFAATLPAETSLRHVVRKLRVVERSPDQYAIIPILYPAIPAHCSAEDCRSIHPSLQSELTDAADHGERNFHVVGMYAAISLFRTAFSCLRELIRADKVTVSIPAPGDADDSISHLKALYPHLDVSAVRAFVQDTVESGRTYHLRKSERRSPVRIEATTGMYAELLESLQWSLLRRIRSIQKQTPGPFVGALIPQLSDLSETLSARVGDPAIRQALLSAAVDQAIDSASIVTGTACKRYTDNRNRWVRTFNLDGELVCADVERVATMWRFDSPPPLCSATEA